MSAFRTMVNNLFLESFDTIFIRNRKNCQNINCFFFFYKKFSLNGLLTFARASVSIFHNKIMSMMNHVKINNNLTNQLV